MNKLKCFALVFTFALGYSVKGQEDFNPFNEDFFIYKERKNSYYDSISLVRNGNNGWSALSLTFTTPANLQANTFNQMEISIDNLPLNVNDDEIVYLDDLSLLELSSGRDWPQYVNAGLGINGASGNDIWSNSIKKDSQENLYLMLAVRNDNLDIT